MKYRVRVPTQLVYRCEASNDECLVVISVEGGIANVTTGLAAGYVDFFEVTDGEILTFQFFDDF